jgi:hypothetical protein
MEKDALRQARPSGIDPVRNAIFHAILVGGILAVHFGVYPLW